MARAPQSGVGVRSSLETSRRRLLVRRLPSSGRSFQKGFGDAECQTPGLFASGGPFGVMPLLCEIGNFRERKRDPRIHPGSFGFCFPNAIIYLEDRAETFGSGLE